MRNLRDGLRSFILVLVKGTREFGPINAMLSADQIRKNSPLLREQLNRGEIMLVSAIYDVDSGRVTFDSAK